MSALLWRCSTQVVYNKSTLPWLNVPESRVVQESDYTKETVAHTEFIISYPTY